MQSGPCDGWLCESSCGRCSYGEKGLFAPRPQKTRKDLRLLDLVAAMGGGEKALTELRCAFRFDRSTRELLLAAEVLAETEHGRWSQILAVDQCVWQDL